MNAFPRFCAAVFLVGSSVAQVFIVDANNGPGTHYTDLRAAVAAVPSGSSIRVRPGSYQPFTVVRKGLRIVGEPGVRIDGPRAIVRIQAITGSQSVLLRNLRLTRVMISNAIGPVVLDGCAFGKNLISTVLAPEPDDVTIDRCADVVLHDCDLVHVSYPSARGTRVASGASIRATNSVLQISKCVVLGSGGTMARTGTSGTGSAGLHLVGSRCELIASRITGAPGGPGCRTCGIGCSANGGRGGIGAVVHRSTLICLDSPITGGAGGGRACCGSTCTQSGIGGVGAAVQDSTVVVFGSEPTGGAGSRRGSSGTTTGTNTIRLDPLSTPPHAFASGSQARGQTVSLRVSAQPMSTAVLIASRSPARSPFDPLIYASILNRREIISAPLLVPSSGTLGIPWTVPTTHALGEMHWIQFAVLDRRGIWATNVFPFVAVR